MHQDLNHIARDTSGFSGMTMRVAPEKTGETCGHPGRGGYVSGFDGTSDPNIFLTQMVI